MECHKGLVAVARMSHDRYPIHFHITQVCGAVPAAWGGS